MKNIFFYFPRKKLNAFSHIAILLLLSVTLIVNNTSASIIPQISAGGFHTAALKIGKTVWTWGNNTYGQLGDGTNTDRNTPVQVDSISNVIAIAGGYWHTVALESDGTVWTWGNNTYGQLGDGTNTDRNTPVQVDGISNVIAIACGYWHTIVLKSDGTVWAWGNNTYGQLGDGSNADSNTAVEVKFGGTTEEIDTFFTTSQASTKAPTESDHATPPKLESSLRNIITIASGGGHTVFLRSDGAILTCGSNYGGQLGDGTDADSNIPVLVDNLSGVITSVAGGLSHTVVLRSDGMIWTWGINYNGQLGDGTRSEEHTSELQ